jgi:hypothetical protein
MKKLTAIIAALAFFFSASAFSLPDVKVPETVKTSFKKSFAGALNINWEKKEDFYFASFQVNDTEVNAVYDEKGELIGAARKMETSKLPSGVTEALKTRFGNYAINTQATEVRLNDQTIYYVTVQDDRRILNLKCFTDGVIFVTNKTKK